MEYFKNLLKKSGWMSIIESLIFAILGIILVLRPNEIVSIIAYIIGAIFIVVGIIKIANYVQAKGKNDLYNNELIYGIMAAVIGLVVIIYSSTISKIFGIIIGIWIIYSSVVRATSALKLKVLKTNIWLYSLLLAIVMFICGLYIILDSGIIVTTVGVIMIIYSILDIIENIIFINNVKKI